MSATRLAMLIGIVAALALVGLFAWRRLSPSQSESERFRDSVLSQLRAAYPNRTFQPVPGDHGLIVVDGFQLGLENLWRKYNQSDKSDQALKELVMEHVPSAGSWTSAEPRFPASFEEARDRLLPQLMSPAIASDSSPVRFPFAGDLFIGLVADDSRAYMYLSKDVLKKWGRSEEDTLAIALHNLDSRSKGLKLEKFENNGLTFIAVDATDGYAAARILLPGLRKVIGQQLGFPFCFGVPNREFLICWSVVGGVDSQASVTTRLKKDFEQQPYPLSPAIFQVTADGTITAQTRAH